ncbi:MAG: class I SAM-dependent methyltransferase [Candidatus Kariarchaeaceae archaeon]|jgi:SAM-dependent methyltransferase
MTWRSIEDSKNLRAFEHYCSYNKDSPPLDIPELPLFVEPFINKEKPLLLDLGCSVGLLSQLWVNAGYIVFGVDQVKEAIQIAKQKVPEANFFVMNAEFLNFYESFDIVFTRAVLQHVHREDKPIIMEQIRKVLKSNGLLLIWEDTLDPQDNDNKLIIFGEEPTYPDDFYIFTSKGWIKEIEKYGFSLENKKGNWFLFRRL